MIEKIMTVLKFADWQRTAFYRFFEILKMIVTGQVSVKKIFSGFMVMAQLIGTMVAGTPSEPFGRELNLDGYSLVFSDDFDGSSLDTSKWDYRGLGPVRCGYNSASQVSVSDGNLLIDGEYLENGEYGAGWYSAAVKPKIRFNRGYFEIRCICNKDYGFWSAFWIQSDHSYDEYSKGGVGGAELDIFEARMACKNTERERSSVTQTIWCNGVYDNDDIDRSMLGTFYVNDIYNKYNTYGLEWKDDEYIFYVNGVETAHSTFGLGVSQVLEDLIVSLEVPDEFDESIESNHSYSTQMKVDYVKVYQKAQ